MKKYISVLLAVLCLCFAGCSDNVDDDPKESSTRIEDTDKTATLYNDTIVPDITSENNDKAEETYASGITGSFAPDSTDGTANDDKDDPDNTEAESTEGKADKNESAPETTTALTVPPIFQTLPEGGIELPDDVWE